jgi:hypothetical protein
MFKANLIVLIMFGIIFFITGIVLTYLAATKEDCHMQMKPDDPCKPPPNLSYLIPGVGMILIGILNISGSISTYFTLKSLNGRSIKISKDKSGDYTITMPKNLRF